MKDKRIKMLKDMLKEAMDMDDQDKIKEIEAEMFQVYGFDNRKGKSMGSGKMGEKKGGKNKKVKGNAALMDATSDHSSGGSVSRGGGAALRGIGFKGVF